MAPTRSGLEWATRPATDKAVVTALLDYVNGSRLAVAKKIAGPVADNFSRERLGGFLDALGGTSPLSDVVIRDLAQSMRGLTLQPTINLTEYGFNFAVVVALPDAESILNYGMALFLDDALPYRAALARCRLPSCGRYYLAARNPKGGPANHNYCTPAHRALAHNSSVQRVMRKRTRKAKQKKGRKV